jgi:hypothetical protein
MIRLELMIALNVVLLISFAPLISSPSLAAKPHFSGTPDIIKDSDLSITVNYQAKELGKKTANVTLSSHTTALIGCVNPGGQLSPSKGVQSEETQSQSVQIKPKDGKIKGSLNSGPPTFPSVLSVCPNKNWHTSILSLTYENVVMVIQQKNSEILKFNFGNVP